MLEEKQAEITWPKTTRLYTVICAMEEKCTGLWEKSVSQNWGMQDIGEGTFSGGSDIWVEIKKKRMVKEREKSFPSINNKPR